MDKTLDANRRRPRANLTLSKSTLRALKMLQKPLGVDNRSRVVEALVVAKHREVFPESKVLA
jgi:hypothetical protein